VLGTSLLKEIKNMTDHHRKGPLCSKKCSEELFRWFRIAPQILIESFRAAGK
jgi:hypothetical protein